MRIKLFSILLSVAGFFGLLAALLCFMDWGSRSESLWALFIFSVLGVIAFFAGLRLYPMKKANANKGLPQKSYILKPAVDYQILLD